MSINTKVESVEVGDFLDVTSAHNPAFRGCTVTSRYSTQVPPAFSPSGEWEWVHFAVLEFGAFEERWMVSDLLAGY